MGDEAEQRAGWAWYSRPEVNGPWRMAACAAHGALLAQHRFTPATGDVAPPFPPPCCPICDRPETIQEIERCTCERAPGLCPEHAGQGQERGGPGPDDLLALRVW